MRRQERLRGERAVNGGKGRRLGVGALT
jgi:hypothetical protein